MKVKYSSCSLHTALNEVVECVCLTGAAQTVLATLWWDAANIDVLLLSNTPSHQIFFVAIIVT